MTPKQISLARHALGLPNKQNMTYRNHYCIGPGGDGYEDWEDLVTKELATKAVGGQHWSGDFFYLTHGGAKLVLLKHEHIGAEDARRMRGMVGA